MRKYRWKFCNANASSRSAIYSVYFLANELDVDILIATQRCDITSIDGNNSRVLGKKSIRHNWRGKRVMELGRIYSTTRIIDYPDQLLMTVIE